MRAGFTPDATEGTTLGLILLQQCVNDYYLACDNQSPAAYPDSLFHAAWPRSSVDTIEGIAFKH